MASSIWCQYQGTGSVSQGLATTVEANIYSCPNGRIPAIGSIAASDNTMWTVPAVVDLEDASFPFASVLYNPCTGVTYNTSDQALAALPGTDIVTIDPDGEVITGFIFADNYFELWVNGVPVGKDDVPYTQFNSNIVRFRVQRPFTLAMLLVDWEEHLGIGTEANGGFTDHAGDGGLVAVFTNSLGQIIATTGSDWKAQVFYTAPIMDLSCPQEVGAQRLSSDCSTQDSNDGSGYHALHWPRPADWTGAAFNDADWPPASTYTNAEVGVNNKPAYTNFTNVFDDPQHDASFIWSTNLILDNEVLVRHTVDVDASVADRHTIPQPFRLLPAGSDGLFALQLNGDLRPEEISGIRIRDLSGRVVKQQRSYANTIDLMACEPGLYVLCIGYRGQVGTITFIR